MSAIVKRYFDSLKVLSKAPKRLRVAVLNNSDNQLIKALCEVIHNVLQGKVKLSAKQIKQLKRYHKLLFAVTKKSTSVKRKREILVQQGGFLTALLPPAIALLASLLSR